MPATCLCLSEAFGAVHELRPHVVLEELVVYLQIGNVWLLRLLHKTQTTAKNNCIVIYY